LLLQAPGAVEDSYGVIHVRNEHANGSGVGAAQWGERRGFFAGISKKF
jgi:hypothetical protein